MMDTLRMYKPLTLPSGLVELMSTLFPKFPSKWEKNWDSVVINGYVTTTSRIYTIYLFPVNLSEDIIKKAKLLGFERGNNILRLCYGVDDAPSSIKRRTA